MIKQETWQSYLRAVKEGSRGGSRLGTAFSSFPGSATGLAGLPPAQAANWKENGWHSQRTPGAYECWHFEMLNQASSGVVVDLFDGLYFHPAYRRHSARYYRSSRSRPQAAVWEQALPAFYPGAMLAFFQGGRCVARSINLYPPGACKGDIDSPEFSVGPNHVTLRQDGSFGIVARGYPLVSTLAGPRHRTDQFLLVELTLQPTFAGAQRVRPLWPDSARGGHHTWVIGAPHGEVSGRVQHLDSNRESVLFDMPIQGVGYHDHIYGDAPLGLQGGTLSRGRAVVGDGVLVWHLADPAHTASGSGSINIFSSGSDRSFVEQAKVRVQHGRRSAYLMRYPTVLTLRGADEAGRAVELQVRRDRVLDTTPWSVLSRCAVEFRHAACRPVSALAVMETVNLRRLTWPILGALASRSIFPVAADDPLWRQ